MTPAPRRFHTASDQCGYRFRQAREAAAKAASAKKEAKAAEKRQARERRVAAGLFDELGVGFDDMEGAFSVRARCVLRHSRPLCVSLTLHLAVQAGEGESDDGYAEPGCASPTLPSLPQASLPSSPSGGFGGGSAAAMAAAADAIRTLDKENRKKKRLERKEQRKLEVCMRRGGGASAFSLVPVALYNRIRPSTRPLRFAETTQQEGRQGGGWQDRRLDVQPPCTHAAHPHDQNAARQAQWQAAVSGAVGAVQGSPCPRAPQKVRVFVPLR